MRQVRGVPFAVVCAIAVAGCAALAFAGAAAIMGGVPYRPERYAGGIDPVRAGLAAFMFLALVVFCLFVLADLAIWRRDRDRLTLATALMFAGLTISVASLLILIVTMPPVSRLAVPMPVRVMLYAGVGVSLVGFLPALAGGLGAAIRRRDAGFLVVLLVFVALLAVRALTGP